MRSGSFPAYLLPVVAVVTEWGIPNALGGCIYHAVVRPSGRIRPTDAVRIDVRIKTSSTPISFLEPTSVTQEESAFLIELYADGGPGDSYDQMILPLDLGMLLPGTYTYTVNQHATPECGAETVNGSFCVDAADCTEETCTCPVFCPHYNIEPLGTMQWAWGMNDLGQVVGRGYSGGNTAVLWDGDELIALGVLAPNHIESDAWDINNAGQVVGSSYGPTKAFIWFNGTMSALPDVSSPMNYSYAYAINENGGIVGFFKPNAGSPDRPVIWENGQPTDLSPIFGTYARAWDINNAGQIVAADKVWDGQTAITIIGPQYTVCEALAINNSGMVAGSCYLTTGGSRAILWQDGVFSEIGNPQGYYNTAHALNDHGEALASGDSLWSSNVGMRRLRDLIATDNGWYDLVPTGINNSVQICGYGMLNGQQRAFLMTPTACEITAVPAVSSGTLVAMLTTMTLAGAVILKRLQTRQFVDATNLDASS